MIFKLKVAHVISLVTLILVSFVFNQENVFAQTTAGVGITPAIISERLDPGEVKQFSIQLRNLSGNDQTFYLSRRDIVGVRDGNVPIFANEVSERTGYELTDWITLDKTEVFIPAEGEDSVSFIMQVPETASPGSHFGGIIVSVEPPEIRNSGASIGYEVANIISIRIAGEANDLARIRQFSTSQYFYSKTAVDFEARIENEGNTLVTPVGPLEIFNMFGKRVALLDFNQSQKSVFPKTKDSAGLTSYQIAWVDDGLGFGRYEARLSLIYGEEGKKSTISSTATFWILPMNIIGPGLVVLIVLLATLYFLIRLYVRRSVAMMSTGSTRRLIRTRQRNQFPMLLMFVAMLAVTAIFLVVLLLLFA